MADLPCSWNVSCQACPGFETAEDWQSDAALWLAGTYLWAATGRQYGTCPVTVHPNQARWSPDPAVYPEWMGTIGMVGGPFLFAGRWFNAACGSACCGARGCAVVLRGPVAAIEEVTDGGEVVPASAYRVDVTGGQYLLVRTDGACWPTCNPDGDFAVTYRIGHELPEALKVVTALLACEYLKAFTGDPDCRLPARMTSLTRQGVQLEVAPADPAEGKTGIREVDDIVQALNPSRRQRPPAVLSPDLAESCDRMTVIPAGG